MSRTSFGRPSGPPPHVPGRMVPPYTMKPGLLSRPSAISVPGMFLSHPGMTIIPSSQCPPATDSTESAMRSRDWREYDTAVSDEVHVDSLPRVPILIPSDTASVPN